MVGRVVLQIDVEGVKAIEIGGELKEWAKSKSIRGIR